VDHRRHELSWIFIPGRITMIDIAPNATISRGPAVWLPSPDPLPRISPLRSAERRTVAESWPARNYLDQTPINRVRPCLGCRRGDDRSSAIHGRDDRRARGRRIYNQLADQPYVDRLSLWADPGLGIGLHDARRDVRCRRFFVWLLIVWAGEPIRSRTFMIKKNRPSCICRHSQF
jgi:hypothetical protein